MSILRQRTEALRPAMAGTALRSAAPLAAAVALALALQFVVKPMMGEFHAKLLVDIGINVILAVSLTMVNGFTGQFSIGHAAFMMIGAYVAACVVYYGSMLAWGAPDLYGGLLSSMITGREAPLATSGDGLFLIALICAGLVAALCGYLVGLPSLRLRGDYLAIVTLGFGEIVRVLIQSQTQDVLYTVEEVRETAWYLLPTKLGGALGFSGLPFYTSLFWVTLVTGLTLATAYRIKMSATGRAYLSIREDEIASEAMGVNTTRFKVQAFVISAFFAGVAGGLFAHNVGVQLNPGELGFQKSFDLLIMVVLGGLGSISGATIAAAILTLLPEALRNPEPLFAFWPWLTGLSALMLVWLIAARATGRSHRPATALFALVTSVIALGGLAKWAMMNGHNPGDYRMILFALALVLMMLLRPQGLFGVREIWDRSLWRDVAALSRRDGRDGGGRRP